jgi:hypothetical protein
MSSPPDARQRTGYVGQRTETTPASVQLVMPRLNDQGNGRSSVPLSERA